MEIMPSDTSIEITRTKVIVAEDQPAMRRMIAAVLRGAGYEVVEASDGANLWEEMNAALLDETDPRPADLVVSDVRGAHSDRSA